MRYTVEMKVLGAIARGVGNLLLFVALIGSGYFLYTQLVPPVPCKKPIQYSLGTFDERFGITREELLATLERAEAIWEKPIGKELFVYDPEGALAVNLIYDSRQQTTERNRVLTGTANETKEVASSVQAEYQALKNAYASEKASYESALAVFNTAGRKYSDEVAYYNSRGGAPKADYERLQEMKRALDEQQRSLEGKRIELNTAVAKINKMIDTYNLLVDHVNVVVGDINKTAGTEFEEGLYIEEGTSKRIDIYEFSSKIKLLRVLAHELGHALTLEHNPNPKSIMYELNQSSTETVSPDDLADLQALCSTTKN